MWRNRKRVAFLIACNFVIHPQMLIFSVFKIASFPTLIADEIFHVAFFYLFTFVINLWHRKFVTGDVTAVFGTNQHCIQWREQDFDFKNCIWRGTQQRALILLKILALYKLFAYLLTYLQTNFLRKAGQSVVLRDTGTVNRRPGSGRQCS